MNITKTFELEAVRIQGRVYVQWSASCADWPGSDDNRMRARWNAFQRKHNPNRDQVGRYYESAKHANAVIKAFRRHVTPPQEPHISR